MIDDIRRIRELSGQVGLFEMDEPEDMGMELPVGKHNHMEDEEFDAEQLAMGIDVEMEHTDDPELAKAIAKDHLAEVADYYTKLAEVFGSEHGSKMDMDGDKDDLEGELGGEGDMDDLGAEEDL
jgi:hypothetical protein